MRLVGRRRIVRDAASREQTRLSRKTINITHLCDREKSRRARQNAQIVLIVSTTIVRGGTDFNIRFAVVVATPLRLAVSIAREKRNSRSDASCRTSVDHSTDCSIIDCWTSLGVSRRALVKNRRKRKKRPVGTLESDATVLFRVRAKTRHASICGKENVRRILYKYIYIYVYDMLF